jgi:4-aminobutyrate aminotransferase/diaminobutyrate-pyruvate transaminase/4-aminobutyrate aminotransferase/(S)-3-amino-2-methylpropionate transaminase
MEEFSDVIGFAPAVGLVGGLQTVKKGSKDPNGDLAWEVVNLSYRKGLMMFAPVGFGGGCIKIAPPLCINKDATREGCSVIRQSLKEILKR